MDGSIQIHTDVGTDIVSARIESQSWTATRGNQARITLRPYTAQSLTVSSGHTVSSNTREAYEGTVKVESGQTLTIESDAVLAASTLDNNGTVDNNGTIILYNDELFPRARQFGDYAGRYQTVEMLNGVVHYSEDIPSSASVNSLLVGIEPSQSLKDNDVLGIWGLIEEVRDERNVALSNHRLQLRVRVLAEYPDYSDHAAVRSDLEV